MEPRNGKKRQESLFSNLLPTHKPSFQQGHVGDLNTKSKIELEDLLQRQEKLLSNKTFIAKLPDQGAKLIRFSSSLRKRLNKIEEAENISNFSIPEDKKKGNESVQHVIDDDMSDKHEVNNDDETSAETFSEANLSIMERDFSNLEIHEGPHYHVIKKAAERQKKSKFTLNRKQEKDDRSRTAKKSVNLSEITLSQNIPDFSDDKEVSASPKKYKQTSTQVLSSATISDPKKKTVVISMEECWDIHKKQIEAESQIHYAAERFMSKYGMKAIASGSVSSNSETLLNSIDDDKKASLDEDTNLALDDMLDIDEMD